jgi:ribosome maturation factor RimP
MKKPKVEDLVSDLASPVAESLGLELVEVQYIKEGGSWFLRIFIDKPGGITHDHCQALSERMDGLLDEKDIIPHAYIFEVSSPGIERPLKSKKILLDD